jgi:putative membrane protein
MITKSLSALGFAAALALAGAAQAQTTMPKNTAQPAGQAGTAQAQKASKQDQQFLKEAMHGDMAEVKIGQLAQQKGQSQEAKQFGEALQQDHGQNLQQAQSLAQQLNVQAPTGPNAKQTAMYNKLSKLSGAQFDRQFAKDMVQDHKKDIATFRKHAKGQGEVAQFAQQTLPTLQKHLKMAQSIQNQGAAVGQKAGVK